MMQQVGAGERQLASCAGHGGSGGLYALGVRNRATVGALRDPLACCHRQLRCCRGAAHGSARPKTKPRASGDARGLMVRAGWVGGPTPPCSGGSYGLPTAVPLMVTRPGPGRPAAVLTAAADVGATQKTAASVGLEVSFIGRSSIPVAVRL